jgi:hypothetical protein
LIRIESEHVPGRFKPLRRRLATKETEEDSQHWSPFWGLHRNLWLAQACKDVMSLSFVAARCSAHRTRFVRAKQVVRRTKSARDRSVVLVALAMLVGCATATPALGPPRASRHDDAPAASSPSSPLLQPPAGAVACEPSIAETTAIAAARGCYLRRVKPALLALGDNAQRYRFGQPDYIAMVLGLEPRTTVTQATGEAVRRRHMAGMPASLRRRVTALGGWHAVDPEQRYALVEMTLRSDGMPEDGDAVFVFVVEPTTLRTVFVFRILSG